MITKKEIVTMKRLLKDELDKFPQCVKEVQVRNFISGAELIDRGIKEVDGKPVDPAIEKYIERQINTEWIDHYKECMKYIKKYGREGIIRYSFDLRNHLDRMVQKYPYLFNPDMPKPKQAPLDYIIQEGPTELPEELLSEPQVDPGYTAMPAPVLEEAQEA